jgi:hypothetical protein
MTIFRPTGKAGSKSSLRFIYSFASFMLGQYYWRCDFYSANRRRVTDKKKFMQIFVIGAANVPSFTHRPEECTLLCLKTQGSAAD